MNSQIKRVDNETIVSDRTSIYSTKIIAASAQNKWSINAYAFLYFDLVEMRNRRDLDMW